MEDFKYEDWLKTHAKKKTIMEKLERSLVPFQLFSCINLPTINEGDKRTIDYNGNLYLFELKTKNVVNDRDVYLFQLSKIKVTNGWEDILMGFSVFKVIAHNGKTVTIYPYQEHYFDHIIGMFEAEQYYDLYQQKTQ